MNSNCFKHLCLVATIVPFVLVGCSDNGSTESGALREIMVNVDNSGETISLNNVSTYRIVNLESADSILIGAVSKVSVNGDALFVSDRSRIFRFSKDGTFQVVLNKRGDGPEQYKSLSDFVPQNDNQVVILDRNQQSLMQYNWDGKLQKQVKFDYWIDRFTITEDGQVYLYSGNETTEYENSQIHLMDWNTGEINDHMMPVDEAKSMYLQIHDVNLFTGNKNMTFAQAFNDTVYSVKGATIKPQYVVNWNDHNVPRSFFDEEYADVMEFFQKFHQEGIYAYGINPFVDAEQNYWLGFYYQKKYHLAIVDKKSQNTVVADSFLIDEMAGMPLNLANKQVYAQNDGSLVIPIEAGEILEYAEGLDKDKAEEMLNRLKIKSEEDNPLLLIISPK